MAPAKKAPSPDAEKKNARGQRHSHAARLTTRKPAVPKKEGGSKKARGVDVRERVLHAALECFGAFGFEGTSTRAVAERAGVSHPLLLYHFDSKEKLWRNTLEDVVSHYRQDFELRLKHVDRKDAAACLRAFIENFVRFSARVPQLYRIMTQESTQGSERIHWLIDAHLRESFDEVRDMIRRGQAAKQVREGDSARLYYAIIGLAGTLLSVSSEFKLLTSRDVFTEAEMHHTIGFIFDFVFA
ncbi:MAG: TetR/AcrR family transcriptional regulator [Panacagrimonas sp.]